MKKIAAALLLSTAVAVPAFAADNGGYVGVKVGDAKYQADSVTTNDPTAYGVFGGYSFNKNIAVEVEYLAIDKVNTGANTDARGSAWAVAAVGSYPFNDSFSLFGKLGVARTSVKTGPSGNKLDKSSGTYGLGGQYNVNQSVGIRLGWDRYQFDNAASQNSDVNLYSLAGVFKF